MKQRSVPYWAAKFLVLGAVFALPMMVQAQDGQDTPAQGRAAFAGGQMVRGTVTAVSGETLTIKTDAGETFQVAVSANTRLNKDRQPVKVADIKIGDSIGAMGVLDPATKTVHAVFVAVVDAEQAKKMRENMGKTYITGKVTAINMDALKLTVMRTDGVSQVIGVDEQTSFRRGGRGMAALGSGVGETGGEGRIRSNGAGASGGTGASATNGGGGGESITFADVKVGDTVAGRGALKNGLFVPTELGVMDPSAMGQRRRRGTDGGGTGATPTGSASPSGVTPPKAPASPTSSAGVPQ